MSEQLLLDILQFLIFPGSVFAIVMALFFIWLDRKLYARMQNRVGPPLLQPFYDLLKLFGKEEVRPVGADEPEFSYLPDVDLFLSLMTAFLIPVIIGSTLISFSGDLIFFLFLVTLNGTVAFLVGWATNSPYTLVGGARAAVSEIAIELPFALAIIGPALVVGDLQIAVISAGLGSALSENWWLALPLVVLFVLGLIGMVGILERVPFDAPIAETEIIAGWETELNGRGLAMIHLAQEVFHFTLAALLASIFLGGPYGPWTNWNMPMWVIQLIGLLVLIVKAIFILFCLSLTRTILSRIRIDQIADLLWKKILPIAVVSIVVLLALMEMV